MRQGTRLIFLNCPLTAHEHYPSYSPAIPRIECLMRIAARFNITCVTVELAGSAHPVPPLAANSTVIRTVCFDATLMQGLIQQSAPADHIIMCGYEAHVSVL